MAVNDDHIKRILKKSNYSINEVNYNLVTDGIENDDDVPEEIWSQPQPITNGDSTIFEDNEEGEEDPNAAAGDEQLPDETLPPVGDETPAEPTETPPEEEIPNPAEVDVEPEPQPEEPSVNELQNDIIKLNISAMQRMNDKVDQLETTIASFYAKMEDFDKEVEAVREPTNVEKLVTKKQDSHPYYYGLNDMWEGNWFQARRDEIGDKGMKQMEDGSYVADFDTLDKYTDNELKDSFDK